MLFYDISRDALNATVYKDDPKTQYSFVKSIENGDMFNLSEFSMCAHTGTHIDAPFHFDEDGEKIGQMRLSRFFGKCTVVTIDGVLTGEDMERLLPHCEKRIIFHSSGTAYLSSSAAQVLADSKVVLVGTDAMSIAPSFDEMRTHVELARANIAVIENLYLEGVKDGTYTLCAFPLKLPELEAAPCRAVLLDEGKGI